MKIEVVSPLTYKHYKDFFNFCIFGKSRFQSFFVKATFAFTLFFGAVFFGMFITGQQTGFAFFLSLLILVMYWFLLVRFPKIVYNSARTFYSAPSEYIFSETGFTDHCKGELHESTMAMSYACIMKVYETPEYFFIFPDKSRGIIIDKSAFVAGRPEELRLLLMNALDAKKYITKM
ncbi:MAG: hypothetical protein GX051_04110 [Clostridiales bacterium]|nr:hypothetical protein [Clostridiales bacterium]